MNKLGLILITMLRGGMPQETMVCLSQRVLERIYGTWTLVKGFSGRLKEVGQHSGLGAAHTDNSTLGIFI